MQTNYESGIESDASARNLSLQVIRRVMESQDIPESTATDILNTLIQIDQQCEHLDRSLRNCQELSRIDDRTGLLKFNPHHLTQIVKQVTRYIKNENSREFYVSLVRFDIDDFSKINNLYGHEAGDRILMDVAGRIVNNSRPTDYIIRYGGEEFDALLPATDEAGVYEYLVKIFSVLETEPFFVQGRSIPVTLSAGATFYRCVLCCNSCLDENSYVEKYLQLQQEADDALYEAKHMGKSNFRVYRPGRREYYETCRRHYAEG